MLARRPHQKSRNGCMTCKRKKVKCDELKPSCQYCTLRSIQCIYSASESSPPRATRTPNQHISPTPEVSSPRNSAHTVSTPLTSTIQPALSPHHLLAGAQWSVCDLELLHFYTVSTSQTFSMAPDRRHVWQHVVPQIAFSHGFLLHELLALAALHLAQVFPDRKDDLWARASTHHATALPTFRSAVESINSQNCHACSAFGLLITVYEWASTEHASRLFFADTHSPIEASTIEWVQILRGSARIVTIHYEEMINGPLEPILRWDNTADHEADANSAGSVRFSDLELLWDPTRAAFSTVQVDALKEALRWLRITYTETNMPNRDHASIAMSWPVRVPEHFLSMVKERQPAALILLSHFCLLLNKVEDFWWIRGMSRRLLQEIAQALGAEWETWIGWPLQDLVLSEFRNTSPGQSTGVVPP